MSNTDGSENTTFDPTKPFLEILKELLKTPFLYIFSIGTSLIIFGVTRNIPGVGEIESWGSLVLVLFGGWLSFIAINLYKKEDKNNNLKRKYSSLKNSLENDLEQERQKSNQLNQSINQVISLLENKTEKDLEDSKALEILRENTIQALKDTQDPRLKILTSDWLKSKNKKWINYLKNLEYDFLDNRKKRDIFFKDIEKHLNLLYANIYKDVYRTPKVEGLEKAIDDSSSYIRTFQDLRREFREAMKADENILKYEGIEYLNNHIDAFIDLIND